MMRLTRPVTTCALLLAFACMAGNLAVADDKDQAIELGKLKISAPESWKKVQPRVRIITYEFSTPAAKDDEQEGRCTIMAAGGSIDDNVKRWYGQFTQPDGGDTEKRAKVEKEQIAGHTVHTVSIGGTYKDQRGPFAPAVMRPDYRMLAAIIETDDANYFVKLYGPKRTVDAQEKAFGAMIDSLRK